jgi:UDP-N-acetylglucosamine 1-carboxyvinyltransferase
MDAFRVLGGRRLRGTVEIGGAKNAALPMMAAALLVPGRTLLRRVPHLRDVRTMRELLGALGVRGDYTDHCFEIDASNLDSHVAPYDIVRRMRASIYALGPLLARVGKAKVSLPGGCAWGPRPVDLHLKGMEALGARVSLEEGYILAEAPPGGLRGGRIAFDISSVGATGNVLMAATLAKGTTVIENAACEPDIVALAEFLIAAGARITGQGTATVAIEGVTTLHPVEFENIPDRIEAGTYAVAAAITGGDVLLRGARADQMAIVLERLREMGVAVTEEAGGVRVRADHAAARGIGVGGTADRGTGTDGTWFRGDGVGGVGTSPSGAASVRERLRAIDVTTQPYPGFPTDLQAQFTALLCLAEGTGVVTDTIYPDRFTHIPELIRLGAEIRLHANVVTVSGVASLQGAEVMSTDIRASSALVLAGLAAEGETRIHRVYHIDRGYESIETRLQGLGGMIERYNAGGP